MEVPVLASRVLNVVSIVAARIPELGAGNGFNILIGGNFESLCATKRPTKGSQKWTTESLDTARRNLSTNPKAITHFLWPVYVHWQWDIALPSPYKNKIKIILINYFIKWLKTNFLLVKQLLLYK